MSGLTDTPMTRAEVLDEAREVITGARQEDYGEARESFRRTADFIARARDDVPRLVAALRGVLATHQEDTCKCCQCGTACRECRAPWPCPTVREITEALGVES